jgi:hypothetical protein
LLGRCYKESITLAGLFFFVFFPIFGLCVSIMPLGHYVIAEARCNWYLPNINIFPLSKK